MKAVLHESGCTYYHRHKGISQTRLEKLMKKKEEKKSKNRKKSIPSPLS